MEGETGTGPLEIEVDQTINFDKVKKVLREILVLDEDVEITPKTKLIDLEADPFDVLNIYFGLGMNFADYTSGGSLNNRGKELLYGIADAQVNYFNYSKYSDVMHSIKLGMSKTTDEFINQLTVEDLIDIKNYEVDRERIKQDIETFTLRP